MLLLGKLNSFRGKSLVLSPDEPNRVFSPQALGLGENFYGGSVNSLAEVEPGVYYCLDKYTNQPKDVLILDFAKVSHKTLKEIAKIKGIEHKPIISKDELLELFGVKIEKKGGEEDA